MKILVCFVAFAVAGVLAKDVKISYSILKPGADGNTLQVEEMTIDSTYGYTLFDAMVLQDWFQPVEWGIKYTEEANKDKTITSLAGVPNTTANKWQLYTVSALPTGNVLPTDAEKNDVFPNKIIIEEAKHYLYNFDVIPPPEE